MHNVEAEPRTAACRRESARATGWASLRGPFEEPKHLPKKIASLTGIGECVRVRMGIPQSENFVVILCEKFIDLSDEAMQFVFIYPLDDALPDVLVCPEVEVGILVIPAADGALERCQFAQMREVARFCLHDA